MIPLQHGLILAAILFVLGLTGLVIRRNLLFMLIGLEIMKMCIRDRTWKGHPLRKDCPARATEFSPFELTKAKQDLEMEALTFKPEECGMKRGTENEDFMFLNHGPNHPSSHGLSLIHI